MLFTQIFLKILSTLLNIIVGFIAGKSGKVERDSIASLLFYFITPIVFFSISANAQLNFTSIGILFITYFVAVIMSIITYYLAGIYFSDQTRNILSAAAGTGNVGYFVLPVAIFLFNDYTLSLYMIGIIGLSLFDSSIGFFICMRSTTSMKESFKRTLKLPMLSGFILGCIFGLLGINLPDFLRDFISNIRVIYASLGMIMVGLGVSKLKKFTLDTKFIIPALISRYIIYPLIMFGVILLDKFVLKIYDINYYNALQLISFAPMAASTIVIASLVGYPQERVASAVLLSALISLFHMPIMIMVFIK